MASLTAAQIKQKINTLLADNSVGAISEADIREILTDIVDSFGATDVSNTMPTWTAGLTFQTDGSDSGEFCRYQDTSGNIRLWVTKVDDNINNTPPTDTNVTENTFWKEVSASNSAAFPEWAAGIYGEGLIIVYHMNAVYKLDVAQRPYNSVNIQTEIANWDWIDLTGSSSPNVYNSVTFDAVEDAGVVSVPFDYLTTNIAQKVIDAQYDYQPNATGAVDSYGSKQTLFADGDPAHIPTFTGFTKWPNSDDWDNTAGAKNEVIFYLWGSTYYYNITNTGQASDTPPTFSNVSVDNLSDTTADFNAQINEAGTIFWAAFPTATAQQTKAVIEAGTGAVDFDSVATSGSTIETDNVTGLTAITGYKIHYFARDSAGNESDPAITSEFSTTAAGDTTPPTFSAGPASANVSDTSFDITATLNENGTVYAVVVADGASAPSSAEVKAGTGSGGSGQLATDSAVDSGSGVTLNLTGLTSSTAYDVYVVAEDDEGTPNLQASPTLVNVTTTSGDVAAPTVTSFTIENGNPDLANIVFNETVVFPDVTGLSLNGDFSDITLSNPTGSGANWSVDLSRAAVNGESGSFVYGATNNIEDTSGNGLLPSSTVVTNNLANNSILLENDFDTAYTEVSPGAGITFTPTATDLLIENNGTDVQSVIANYRRSNNGFNDTELYFKFNVSSSTGSYASVARGAIIYIDSNNFVHIVNNPAPSSAGELQIQEMFGGTNTINFYDPLQFVQAYKVKVTSAAMTVYYWDGSSWALVDTFTRAWGSVNKYFQFGCGDNPNNPGAITFNQTYITNSDFATLNP
jgi:hypothetical protein